MPARNSKSQAAFHHRLLSSPRSIRLLALLPSLEFQAPLETTLTEAGLDDVSETEKSYEALSYVWGSRFGTEPSQRDGKILLVIPNCESALRHLRLKDKTRILWVDAICIDQENGESASKSEMHRLRSWEKSTRRVPVRYVGLVQAMILRMNWWHKSIELVHVHHNED
jgi:hypothetical protein